MLLSIQPFLSHLDNKNGCPLDAPGVYTMPIRQYVDYELLKRNYELLILYIECI